MTTLGSILVISIFVLLIIYFFVAAIKITDLNFELEKERHETKRLKEENQILERRIENITTINYWSQKQRNKNFY